MNSENKVSKVANQKFFEEKLIDTRMRGLAKLFLILYEIYSQEKTKDKLGKREGQQVQVFFLAFDKHISFTLSKINLSVNVGPAEGAVATILFKMDKEEINSIISDIIKTKANIRGLLKILFKYIIPNKIRFKGSLGAAIRLTYLIMIGKHPMYKESKIVPLIHDVNSLSD
jgi:hypothetical protein